MDQAADNAERVVGHEVAELHWDMVVVGGTADKVALEAYMDTVVAGNAADGGREIALEEEVAPCADNYNAGLVLVAASPNWACSHHPVRGQGHPFFEDPWTDNRLYPAEVAEVC